MQLVNILWFGLLITPQALALNTCEGQSFGYKITNPEKPESYFLCLGFMNLKLDQNCNDGFRFSEQLQTCMDKEKSTKEPTENVTPDKPIFFNIFGYFWPSSQSTEVKNPESSSVKIISQSALVLNSEPSENESEPSNDDTTEASKEQGSTPSVDFTSDGLDYSSSGNGPTSEDPSVSTVTDLISDSSTENDVISSEEPLFEDTFIQLSQDIFANSNEQFQDSFLEINISTSEEPSQETSTEENISSSEEPSSSDVTEPSLEPSSEESLPENPFIELSQDIFDNSYEHVQDSSTEGNIFSSEEPSQETSTEENISSSEEPSWSEATEPSLETSSEEPLPENPFIELSQDIFDNSYEHVQDSSTEGNIFSSEEPSQETSTEENVSSSEEPSWSDVTEPSQEPPSPSSEEPLLDNVFIQLSQDIVFNSDDSSENTLNEVNILSSEESSKDTSEMGHDISSLAPLKNVFKDPTPSHFTKESPISKGENLILSPLLSKLSPTKSSEEDSNSKKQLGLHVISGHEKLTLCSFLPDGTFLRDLRSCNKFFVCANSRIFAGHCPDELYFDIDNRVCNFPSLVECKIDDRHISYPLNKILSLESSSTVESDAKEDVTFNEKASLPSELISEILLNISNSEPVSEPNEELSTEVNIPKESESSSVSPLETYSTDEDNPITEEPSLDNTSTEESIPRPEDPSYTSTAQEKPSSPLPEEPSSRPPIEPSTEQPSTPLPQESSSRAPEEPSPEGKPTPAPEEPPKEPSPEGKPTSAPEEPLTPPPKEPSPGGKPTRPPKKPSPEGQSTPAWEEPSSPPPKEPSSEGKPTPAPEVPPKEPPPEATPTPAPEKPSSLPPKEPTPVPEGPSSPPPKEISPEGEPTPPPKEPSPGRKTTPLPKDQPYEKPSTPAYEELPRTDCTLLQNGVFLRDVQLCGKYYVCSNGKAIPQHCPNGLYFDIKKKVCNFPSLVDCSNMIDLKIKKGSITLESSPKEPTRVESSSFAVAEDIRSASQEGTDCTYLENGVFLRDPQLCGKFYVCSNGKAIPQHCPDFLHFDLNKNICNHPSLVDCSNGNAKSKGPDCGDLPNGSHIRDDQSCSKIYICANGVPIARQCPHGLYFDIVQGYCNIPSLVNCSIKNSVEANSLRTERDLPDCSGKEDGTSIRDSKLCNKYFICRNGQPITYYCTSGNWFDIDRQICANKRSVECNI